MNAIVAVNPIDDFRAAVDTSFKPDIQNISGFVVFVLGLLAIAAVIHAVIFPQK